MALKPQVRYGVAGLLEFYLEHGRSDDGNVDVSLFKSGTTALDGWTNPTEVALDGYSQQPSVAADKGDVELTITPTGAKRGRRYIHRTADGEIEEVTLDGVGSTKLKLADGLEYPATTGSTIESHRLEVALDTTNTGTRRRDVEVLLRYTADGIACEEWHRFDVVYRPWHVTLTEQDLDKQWTGFTEIAGRSESWAPYVEGAHDDLELELLGREVTPDLIKNPDYFRPAIALFVILSYFTFHGEPGGTIEAVERKLLRTIKNLSRAPIWYDADDDNTKDDADSGWDESKGLPPGRVRVY